MNRVDERRDFESGTRLTLLESDMDRGDVSLEGIRDEIKALRLVLIGILVSAATASILLAINVVVGAVGG